MNNFVKTGIIHIIYVYSKRYSFNTVCQSTMLSIHHNDWKSFMLLTPK